MNLDFRSRLRRSATQSVLDLGTRSDGARLELDLHHFDRSVLVTGPTGTGKTRLLRRINVELAEKAPHVCQVVIGPKGSYAGDLRRDYYRRGWRRRVTFLNLAERRRIGGLNVLRRWGHDELQAKAARDTLMRSVGVSQLDAMPSLARWTYAALLAAVSAGLTIVEAGRLIEVQDGGLRRAIIRRMPPSVARQDLDELESMAEHFRRGGASGAASVLRYFDDQVGSTLRRFRFLGENPVLYRMLGTERSLSWDDQLRPGHTTIIDASLADALDEEDQRHVVLCIVNDVARVAFTRSPRERVRVVLTIDEVGRFPTPVLSQILDMGRELGLTLVAAHQYLAQFDDPKQNDRRLRDSFLADTATKIIFGALPPADARELSALTFEHHLDPDKVQLELRSQRQLSQVVEATSETRGDSRALTRSVTVAHTEADGEASGESDGWSESQSESVGTVHVTGHVVTTGASESESEGLSFQGGALQGNLQITTSEAASRARSASESDAESRTSSRSRTDSHTDSLGSSHIQADTYATSVAHSRARSKSTTRSPMVVPTEVFEEVSSVQLEPLATQLHRHTAALINQPARHAHLILGKEPPIPFCVADVPDPAFTEGQALLVDVDMWNANPGVFSTAEEIDVEIEERQQALIGEGQAHSEVVELPTREELRRLLDSPSDSIAPPEASWAKESSA